MSMNLLDSIKGEINSIVIDKISNYLNVARGNTSNAITAVIPSVLGFLAEKSKSETGANNLVKAATDNELSSMFNGNTFQGLFERNRDSLMAKGNALLVDIFGGKEAKFSEEIAKYANISKEASDGVLASIFPLILSVLGNKISNDGLNASNVSTLFETESDSIYSAIPAGLVSLGGLLGLDKNNINLKETSTVKTEIINPKNDKMENKNVHKQDDRKTYIKEDKDNGGGMMKWLLPLLGIIAAAILIYFLMKQCKNDDAEVTPTEEVSNAAVKEYTLNSDQTVVNAAGTALLAADGTPMVIDDVNYKLDDAGYVINANGEKALDMDGNQILIVDELASAPAEVKGQYDSINNRFIYDVGEDTEIALPSGERLNVGSNSTEAKLYQFLSDDSKKVSDDKTQDWIVLDRVYFETSSNNLDVTSLDQLNKIAKILEEYPNVKLKLGGYTDNSGTQEINQPLSQQRAETVMNDLVKAGIAADRLEAEGYGAQHFVCPANDTPECMAQNRRVDIRVTSK